MYSEEKEQEIKSHIEKGCSAYQIARDLGCDYKAIKRRVEKYRATETAGRRVKRRRTIKAGRCAEKQAVGARGRRLSDARVADIRRMVAEGMTNVAIAEASGCHTQTVAKYRQQLATEAAAEPVLVKVSEPVFIKASDSDSEDPELSSEEFADMVGEALSHAQADAPREVVIQLDHADGKFVRECADAFALSEETVVRVFFQRGLARTKEILK